QPQRATGIPIASSGPYAGPIAGLLVTLLDLSPRALWLETGHGARPKTAAFFLPLRKPSLASRTPRMKNLIASLKSGNWKALLACFLYFDTGFTVWVMFGPLAPFISRQISLSPTESGFLVAVPVLAASIVRVTLGNLFQSVNGRKLALLGITLS